MLLPTLPLLYLFLLYLLYRHLATRATSGALWQAALVIGCSAGVTRAVLAGAGWYLLEEASGPLQIPAYLLVMLAWPEVTWLTSRGAASPVAPGQLAILLVGSTMLLVVAVALAADQRNRSRGRLW